MNEVRLSLKNKKVFTTYLVIVLLLVSFMAGLYLGRSQYVQNNLQRQNTELVNKDTNKTERVDFDLFWNVWETIEKKYVDDLDYQKMLRGAITGMVAALDDPYTVYMDPETSQEFQKEIAGIFEGIGAEIGIKKDKLTIISPLPSSPAEQAGVKARDTILMIDGENTTDMNLIEAAAKIRGEEGSQVTLNIIRDSWEEAKDIVITRDKIEVQSVTWDLRKYNQKSIAYIELTYFGEDTTTEFKKTITDIMAYEVDGVILDLRGNSGGYLETAIDVSSEFVASGQVITIESFSDGEENKYKAKNGSRLVNLPVVVLIDEGSASASEIVAGVLRDHRQSKLIGQKSYGKGSVQELENYNDGSSLRVSIAKWLTPSGKNINGEGLSPDIEVELSDDDYDNDLDPQLDKALEVITQ
ncbi:S41 family peptidase [Patescibacteria group bacterium]|nr:S41 family peptidase [Patescibacteria group bacterium]